LDLLEYLAERGEAKVGEIARSLDAPRASVHRILLTLQARGYVEQPVGTQKYRLGIELRALASRSTASALLRLAVPALAALAARTGETANLGVVRRGRIVYAATHDGVQLPRMSAVIGNDVEPHASALGKAILATLPSPLRASLLPPAPFPAYTPHSITKPEALERDLALAAERGFAIDHEEIAVGAVCIAAPILASDGRATAALSVSGLAARMPDALCTEIGLLIQEFCVSISDELYTPEEDRDDA